MQEHWNDMNHEFINFKVTEVTMQLRRSVIVVFSVDLECMWVSVCLSEELQLSGDQSLQCPSPLDQFPSSSSSSSRASRGCAAG